MENTIEVEVVTLKCLGKTFGEQIMVKISGERTRPFAMLFPYTIGDAQFWEKVGVFSDFGSAIKDVAAAEYDYHLDQMFA